MTRVTHGGHISRQQDVRTNFQTQQRNVGRGPDVSWRGRQISKIEKKDLTEEDKAAQLACRVHSKSTVLVKEKPTFMQNFWNQ